MATTIADKRSEFEALQAEIARLTAENSKLRVQRSPGLTFKVSDKGAVSVYGLGKWPVTLYQEQWEKLADKMPDLLAFAKVNSDKLHRKAA